MTVAAGNEEAAEICQGPDGIKNSRKAVDEIVPGVPIGRSVQGESTVYVVYAVGRLLVE